MMLTQVARDADIVEKFLEITPQRLLPDSIADKGSWRVSLIEEQQELLWHESGDSVRREKQR